MGSPCPHDHSRARSPHFALNHTPAECSALAGESSCRTSLSSAPWPPTHPGKLAADLKPATQKHALGTVGTGGHPHAASESQLAVPSTSNRVGLNSGWGLGSSVTAAEETATNRCRRGPGRDDNAPGHTAEEARRGGVGLGAIGSPAPSSPRLPRG